MKFVSVWLIVFALSIARILGATHPAYQAVAHLFVGGLFAAWFVRTTTVGGGWNSLVAAVTVTAVEVSVAFKFIP